MAYTAQVAKMEDLYNVCYRVYCQFTHGTQVAVTGQLNPATNDLDTPIVTQLVLASLKQLDAHTAAKIPRLETYYQRSRELTAQINTGVNPHDITK